MRLCRVIMVVGYIIFVCATGSTETNKGFPVQGIIVAPPPMVSLFTGELRSLGDPTPESFLVNPDGSFVIHARRQGSYSLKIIGLQGQVLWDEIVELNHPMQVLSIYLPLLSDSTSSEATVSVAQLSHEVPSAARKAFNKGKAAVRNRNERDALKHFGDAVKIDPQFADAHVELGGALVAAGSPIEAVEQYEQALALIPNHEVALFNLCITLGKMQRWRDAKAVARRSLSLDPGRPEIMFILAVSLMSENGDMEEALQHFLRASPAIPKARLLAADLLSRLGHPSKAAEQLREYLKVSDRDDQDADRVRSWLMQLSQ